MKKALSVILSLLLVLSLCAFIGCSQETEPADSAPPESDAAPSPADSTTEVYDIGGYVSVSIVTAADGSVTYDGLTREQLGASMANEHVPQKLAAGMDVLVGVAHMQLGDQHNIARNEGLKNALEELGFTYAYEAFDFDAGKQLQLIENYLTMGAALIETNMLDVAASIELCERTEAQGCYFVVMGATPDGYVSCSVNVDQTLFGTKHAEIFLDWVDKTYPDAGPGDIKICFLGNIRNADPAVRTYAVEARLAQDERIAVAFSNHDTLSLEGAYSLVENAFQADPNICAVLTFNISQATGASNYIVSLPGIDYSKYGVFCNNYDNAIIELIEASSANDGTSVLRGTIINGSEVPHGDELLATTDLLLRGVDTPHYIDQQLWTINSTGFEM